MSTELEQRVAKLEEFASDVRAFTAAVRDIIRRYDERFDEQQAEQSNADARIAALADAQIKTEDALQQLIARVDKLTDALERHAGDEHAHEV